MSVESPLAEEISSVPITGVENGGVDYREHPRIAYGAEYVEDVAYNQAGQSTVIFQWSAVGADWEYGENFFPKHVTLYMEVEDEQYFMSKHVEGAAFYLYRGAGEGQWYANKSVLWVAVAASSRLMRGFRVKGNVGALLTSKAPTPDWKVTLRKAVGIEDHYFIQGYYVEATGASGWFAFAYQLADITIDTYLMIMNGSIKTQPT